MRNATTPAQALPGATARSKDHVETPGAAQDTACPTSVPKLWWTLQMQNPNGTWRRQNQALTPIVRGMAPKRRQHGGVHVDDKKPHGRTDLACKICRFSGRVVQTDDRLEQFRSTIRRDALDIALTVQRAGQDMQHHQQTIEHIKSTLFEDVQERVKSFEERLRSVMDHEVHVNQTIDRNTHSQCASISALISEQGDVRKLVEELANRLDQSQEASSTAQSEVSTNVLLEISDLKSKFLCLTEQSTKLDGDWSFLSELSEQVELLLTRGSDH